MSVQHDARHDHEIFAALAHRLDVGDKFTEGKSEKQWLVDMWDRSDKLAQTQGFELPSFDEFWANKTYRIPDGPERKLWIGGLPGRR